MGYKLLGILVWKGLTSFLRLKYGRAMVPKPVLAGSLLAVLLGVALAARQLSDGGE